MTTTKTPDSGKGGGTARRISGAARLRILVALPAAAAAAAALAACGSSGSSSSSAPASPSASSGGSSPAAAASGASGTVKTAQIGGATVLTSSTGLTLYTFAPDTSTKSACDAACAQSWPPVTGPVTASGVTGTFGTIKRSDGTTQATFAGHPLYTFVGDTAPGQATGNGVNAFGGLWYEITSTGSRPAAGASAGSGGGGY